MTLKCLPKQTVPVLGLLLLMGFAAEAEDLKQTASPSGGAKRIAARVGTEDKVGNKIQLETKTFGLEFEVGNDRRLYQKPIGGIAPNKKNRRRQEAYPQAGDGYVCEPALEVVHADGNTSTRLEFASVSRHEEDSKVELVHIKLRDPAYAFEVTLCFRLYRDRDVIEQWTEIVNHEAGPVQLERMASTALLFTPENLMLTHFRGGWADEMNPVTEALTDGIKIFDSKLGTRAAEFHSPSFILSLDGAAQEDHGGVLTGSVEWSGNFQCAFEHMGSEVRALCGVNPFASRYRLESGKKFTTPKMLWAWSGSGLGEMSRKVHAWARDFGCRDGHKPRSILLNNWEATRFDFDFKRIADLFAPAKELGVETFLLDDGWFGNKFPRVNDKAGLGDWEANRQRLPNGLGPLTASAAEQGLRFGIWIEPEMVNPKSELYEKHPDWAIQQPKRELEFQRNQLTLDLTRPEVQEFEWRAISNTFSVAGISYSKWDCNRYLTQPGSTSLGPERQSHLWIDYVNALYHLMGRTATNFPQTELMLCSGGGGRVDYGALKYFHEFWPSDNTDPLRRVRMQWDYSYFFPAIAMRSHVTRMGARPMHFACCVAMSGCFGMDLDLATLSTEEKAICAGAVGAYKNIRNVVQLGDLYRLERPDDAERGAIDYVSPDRSRSVLFVFQLKDGRAAPVILQGLDPARKYKVRELNPAHGRSPLPAEGKSFTGQALMSDGLLPTCAHALEGCVIELAP